MPKVEVWLSRPDRSILVATCSYTAAIQRLIQVLRINPTPTVLTLVVAPISGRKFFLRCAAV